jgi:hypothetical protein
MSLATINGGNKPNLMKDALRGMKENLTDYIEYQVIMAKNA